MKMHSTLITTPATGLSSCVAAGHPAVTAPIAYGQGSGLPFAAGSAVAPAAAAQVAVLGARVNDLPGSPPRGAPV